MRIIQSKITGTQTSFSVNFRGKLSFILSFVFCRASTAATYIFTAPTCTITIITLEPCALKCWVSYWDLIKFHYFAYTTERGDRIRGWKQAQRQGEDRVTLQINSIMTLFRYQDMVIIEPIWTEMSWNPKP
jgi:hypothetical protein